MWKNIDQVITRVECSALPGRKATIRNAVKAFQKHGAKCSIRERETDNGYLYLVGSIEVNGASYVAARETMWKIRQALEVAGIDFPTLTNRF